MSSAPAGEEAPLQVVSSGAKASEQLQLQSPDLSLPAAPVTAEPIKAKVPVDSITLVTTPPSATASEPVRAQKSTSPLPGDQRSGLAVEDFTESARAAARAAFPDEAQALEQAASEVEQDEVPVKRPRGRPLGSGKKKHQPNPSETATAAKRPRGRPPGTGKNQSEAENGVSIEKRPRGRPFGSGKRKPAHTVAVAAAAAAVTEVRQPATPSASGRSDGLSSSEESTPSDAKQNRLKGIVHIAPNLLLPSSVTPGGEQAAQTKRRGRPPGSKNKVQRIKPPPPPKGVRKAGRPPGSKNRSKEVIEAERARRDEIGPRKRGRPQGSVNKPKQPSTDSSRPDTDGVLGSEEVVQSPKNGEKPERNPPSLQNSHIPPVENQPAHPLHSAAAREASAKVPPVDAAKPLRGQTPVPVRKPEVSRSATKEKTAKGRGRPPGSGWKQRQALAAAAFAEHLVERDPAVSNLPSTEPPITAEAHQRSLVLSSDSNPPGNKPFDSVPSERPPSDPPVRKQPAASLATKGKAPSDPASAPALPNTPSADAKQSSSACYQQ